MEEKLLIIADAIQIEETLFVRHSISRVLSHPTTNLLNTQMYTIALRAKENVPFVLNKR